MKKSRILRSAAAVLVSAITVFCSLPHPAYAATTSEIKDQITDLKVENAVIQAQIDSVRSQYNANASEIQALVDKKNAVDQEIALLHDQILNINEQLRIYAALFCLEYRRKPVDIPMELRIYQNDEVLYDKPDPNDISAIMERIVRADKIIRAMKRREVA
mgnify:CR=1 FL=1